MSPGFEPGPDILGRYRLQEALGGGERSLVYRGESLRGGETVALKFLRQRPANLDPRHLDSVMPFLGVEHENLVSPRDRGLEGPPCLVYEFVQGVSLAQLLEKHQRLAPAAALRIVEGLARGVHTLHQRDLSYGAIRPARVLVDRKGKARLTDVGWPVLEALDQGSPPPGPEGLDQRQQAELRSLGALLFEALVGTAPTEGSSQLSSNLADVPGPLDQVVQAALEAQYPSVEHFLQGLGAMIREKSVGSRKTVYEPLADRVLEARSRPAPRLDGGGDLETSRPPPEERRGAGPTPEGSPRRRRSDLLLAVGGAKTVERPRFAGLKVDVGKRSGPTVGQVILLLFLGLGAVGGLFHYSQERIEEVVDPPSTLGPPPERSPRPRGSESGEPRAVPGEEGAREIGQQIIEEPRLRQRMALVERLLSEYPEQAPEVLERLVGGGNAKLRKHLFPFLAKVDPSGSRRLSLLRRSSGGGPDWSARLARSLSEAGRKRDLRDLFPEGRSIPALLSQVAATRGERKLTLELGSWLEEELFGSPKDAWEARLVRWISVSGGSEGPIPAWIAQVLLGRARDSEERIQLLSALARLEGNPELSQALLQTLERLALGWGGEEVEMGADLLRSWTPEGSPLRDRVEELVGGF